jgi:poly-gamma-glutamate capsule biosynthesis protein CapA/YwtB (metallophosphatase superfamily)
MMNDKIFGDVGQITPEVREAIRRRTAYSLPDNPSARGIPPDQIRKHFWSAIAGERQSVLHEIDRVARETNAALDALKKTGFDLLSLANNHAMDRGAQGIAATLDACDRAGLEHIGLYRTPEENEAVFRCG